MSLSLVGRDYGASACPICEEHCKGHTPETGMVFPELIPPKEPEVDNGRTVKVEDE